jgi:galacturan 1,4-alpha-galacturonidase
VRQTYFRASAGPLIAIVISASNSSLIRPILFTLAGAHGAVISNVKLVNSPEWFIFVGVASYTAMLSLTRGLCQVTDSNNVTFNNMNLNAVSTSKNPAKNTDGWDVYRSDSVVIENSNVNNGDDCFSAKPSEVWMHQRLLLH